MENTYCAVPSYTGGPIDVKAVIRKGKVYEMGLLKGKKSLLNDVNDRMCFSFKFSF